jgi:hypothetical protein
MSRMSTVTGSAGQAARVCRHGSCLPWSHGAAGLGSAAASTKAERPGADEAEPRPRCSQHTRRPADVNPSGFRQAAAPPTTERNLLSASNTESRSPPTRPGGSLHILSTSAPCRRKLRRWLANTRRATPSATHAARLVPTRRRQTTKNVPPARHRRVRASRVAAGRRARLRRSTGKSSATSSRQRPRSSR